MATSPTLHVVLVGPSKVGKTTMQALMCNAVLSGLPKEIDLRPVGPESDSLRRTGQEFQVKIRQLPKRSPVDVSGLIPLTPPSGLLRRDFAVGWKDGEAKGADELFGVSFLDFSGRRINQAPQHLVEEIRAEVGNSAAMVVPVLDAVTLVELPAHSRSAALASPTVADVVAELLGAPEKNSEARLLVGPLVTRCETYVASWATEQDRRRFLGEIDRWCAAFRRDLIRKFGEDRFLEVPTLNPLLCQTTGCLRVRKVLKVGEVGKVEEEKDGEGPVWSFVFEKYADFQPRHVGVLAGLAILWAAELAFEGRTLWQCLCDFFAGRGRVWDRIREQLREYVSEASIKALRDLPA